MVGVVVIHLGAGFYRDKNRDNYFKVGSRAVKEAMTCLQGGGTSDEAVVAAISCLEDDAMLNAGTGSNLCKDGSVECDASLMEGQSLTWGGVGAVPNLKNPIKVAHALVRDQREGPHPFGLVPPMMLVSRGAVDYAIQHQLTHMTNLITDKSVRNLKKYLNLVQKDESLPVIPVGGNELLPEPPPLPSSSFSWLKGKGLLPDGDREGTVVVDEVSLREEEVGGDVDLEEEIESLIRLDTVGAIVLDSRGVISAGVSSGGILLKNPGRVGQAASFGAGCWAQPGVGVSTSGVGEYLVRTRLAERIGQHVRSYLNVLESSDLQEESADVLPCTIRAKFEKEFIKSPFLHSIPEKERLAGFIALVSSGNGPELMIGHNTPNMIVSYQTDCMKHPQNQMSKFTAGESICTINMIPLPCSHPVS